MFDFVSQGTDKIFPSFPAFVHGDHEMPELIWSRDVVSHMSRLIIATVESRIVETTQVLVDDFFLVLDTRDVNTIYE